MKLNLALSSWALAVSVLASPRADAQPAAETAGKKTGQDVVHDAGSDPLAALKLQVEQLRQDLEAQRALVDASLAAQIEATKEPTLRFYGFIDAGLQKYFLSDDAATNFVIPTKAPTFVLGNLNLYLDAQPTESWSALAEIRFTNHPNLSNAACSPPVPCNLRRTNTRDITNPSGGWGEINWGSTIIERAYIQWRLGDGLTLRLGSFLTPFGIWNIDHGTPTLISLMVPQFENFEFFPVRQIGIEALGSFHRGAWELGYFAYVSNGRTLGQLDPTADKMLGARLFMRRALPHRLTLGVSGLTGRYSNEAPIFVGKSLVDYTFERREEVAYRETSVGADLSLDVGALRLRSELVYKIYRGETGKREPAFDRPYLAIPDHDETAFYVLGAYRLPWWGLEPFLYFEVYRFPTPLSDGQLMPSVGLNIHFTTTVQLKTQYQYFRFVNFDDLFSDEAALRNQDTHILACRLVIAF